MVEFREEDLIMWHHMGRGKEFILTHLPLKDIEEEELGAGKELCIITEQSQSRVCPSGHRCWP